MSSKRMAGLPTNLEAEAERLAEQWVYSDSPLSMDEYLLQHASVELKAELTDA